MTHKAASPSGGASVGAEREALLPATAELHTGLTAADPAVAGAPHEEWESGVGGAQCDSCGRTTIVRVGTEDMLGVPTFWTCRPCAYGYDNDDESGYDPCNYCPHDNTDHREDGCTRCGCVAAQ